MFNSAGSILVSSFCQGVSLKGGPKCRVTRQTDTFNKKQALIVKLVEKTNLTGKPKNRGQDEKNKVQRKNTKKLD